MPVTQPKNNLHSFVIKAAVSLLITTALMWFLFRFIKLDQLREMVATTDWRLMVVGLGMWMVLYLARSARYVLLAPGTPYLHMLCIASVHNVLLRIMPMRTGDLSYGFLMRKYGTSQLGEALLSLLLFRLLDATTVVLYFATSLVFHSGALRTKDGPELDRTTAILVAVVALVCFALATMNLRRLLTWGTDLLRRVCGAVGLEERPPVQKALGKLEDSVDSFAHVRPRVILQVSGVSLVVWALTYGTFFVIMRAFLMPVGVVQTVLGSTASVVTGFLPIGGLGSIGTLEVGWTFGFYLVGLPESKAAASGFGVSMATLAYTALLGLVGWIGLTLIKRSD